MDAARRRVSEMKGWQTRVAKGGFHAKESGSPGARDGAICVQREKDNVSNERLLLE